MPKYIFYPSYNPRKVLDKRYMKVHSMEKTYMDYLRTVEDFERLDLDKIQHLPKGKRSKMALTYYAYLENTPGSKRAIRECLQSNTSSTATSAKSKNPNHSWRTIKM